MRKIYWRYSRPLGCGICVLFLLLLAWFLRFTGGPPATGAEAQVKLAERRCLRPPGELTEVVDEGVWYPFAVTKRDGELYTYYLTTQEREGRGRKRFTGGIPWRDSVGNMPWGCCIGPFHQFELPDRGTAVMVQWTYVLVKNSDPAVTGGQISIEASLENGDEPYARTWTARAERTDPDYLRFRLELRGGSKTMRQLFSAIYNGFATPGTAAEAEVVFYDADGTETSRLQFDMLMHEDEERSEDNGA